ncbi:PREDICTED: probable cytochrome P450 303a1 [Ceratosolen solmsi marchali]|uniref:Probable cytochrome P450 303a1 n=1 Tax=Ceratosolen solmsi marchali TaxID=326594 RepID=A0AAJ6VMI2_9HYME|nr:PREDICTED: probable cytochrome P450 303a1 [Ceratosolen solmsi marchali]
MVFLVLLLLYYLETRKPKGYPPGPKWLPVLGCALEIARLRKETGYFSEACNILGKKYGSIIGLKIGNDRVVILNDFESMKAMIMNEHCDGRPIGPVYDCRTFGKRQGLLVVDGQLWVEQRRFILRHLRDLGFGRTDMAVQIEFEAAQFVKYYERLLNGEGVEDVRPEANSNVVRCVKISREDINANVGTRSTERLGVVIEMEDFFGVPVLNTLWCMMAGKRYNINDKDLIYLQKIFTKLLRGVDMIGWLFNHFFLKYVAPEMSGYKKFMETHRQLWKFLKDELDNHKKTFDPNSPKDLMDIYLQTLQSKIPDDTFSEGQLLAICVDLFMAGSETSSKALCFGFLFLVLNPEVQKKAQQEIDSIIGRERLPSLKDRPRLTYINAVVLESIRMFMGRTMNIPHRALKNTRILGYKIPKDSMLVVNFNRILMGEFWGDPEEFRPERFIDESGKIVMSEQYLPFSFGKHRCLGEVLAKSNMFMIMAALLQNFTFAPVPGEEPPRNEYTDGVTASPKPFRVLMTKRT